MPLTKLDDHAALILIDLQKGILGIPTVHPAAEIVRRAAQLARAFRERRLPVVLVNVTAIAPGRAEMSHRNFSPPPEWSELAPELGRQASDFLVSKQRVGAFLGTPLDEYLRKHHVTQIFLAGVSTSGGVESTGRNAHDLGYNVVFVVDAMTDRDENVHRNSVEKIFPRMGEIATTENVLKMLNETSRATSGAGP
jgi:nicotinamidase-related amidase